MVLEVRGPASAIRKVLETTPGVTRVGVMDQRGDLARFEVMAQQGADIREELAKRVVSNGWALRTLDLRRSSLEERFVRAVREATVGWDGSSTPEEIEAA